MMHEYSDHDTSDMPSWCSPEGQHVETTLRNMAAHEILLFDNSYSFQWHSLFTNADKLCADSSAEVDKRKTRIIRKLHSAGERERLEHCRTGLKITKMHFISCIHGNLSNTAHFKKSPN